MNDYASMVQTLLKPITPELRRVILLKLTAINDELIACSREIDLDDLLDDIEDPSDSLDNRLANISKLQYQIMESRKRHQKK